MDKLLQIQLFVNLNLRLIDQSFVHSVPSDEAGEKVGEATFLVNPLDSIKVMEHIL